MSILYLEKPAFTVIGKEGSTRDGEDFIARLWEDANSHFDQVAALAKTDGSGTPVGVWGAMTDFSRSFQPWENAFTEGLYLAGVECRDCAEAPEGWVKWCIPGFRYRVFDASGPASFHSALAQLEADGLSLAGAVHDFTDPKTGKAYLYFPIARI